MELGIHTASVDEKTGIQALERIAATKLMRAKEEERRRKESPLKDVAGMLRSFSYAAYAALFAHADRRAWVFERLEPWGRAWQRWTSASFLKGYLAAAGPAPFLPADAVQRASLLDLFLLDKALYELNYELNNRPEWARIPLRGLEDLLG